MRRATTAVMLAVLVVTALTGCGPRPTLVGDGTAYAMCDSFDSTVRTSSATVSVFLTAAEAREWVTLLGDAERKMTGLVLAAAMPAGLVVPGRA